MSSLPTLHLLGLPHTITRDEYSHCAFTGKVKRFAPMLREQGYRVVHYGVEGAESGADEQVDVLSLPHWEALKKESRASAGLPEPTERHFVGDLANVGYPLYQMFNAMAAAELRKRIAPQDLLCLPFGHAHEQAVRLLASSGAPPFNQVETGIGYPTTFCRHLVFESNAWMHWHLGKREESVRAGGVDYHWVVPNYFHTQDWSFNPSPEKDLVLYFGRITSAKGLNEIVEAAKRRLDLRFVLCGQGDPDEWTKASPNITYLPPVHGRARSELLGRAMCVLMPTRFIEPFGGVTIEANLCGTPVLGTGCGSFTETILHGETGYQCRTLGDLLAGIEQVEEGMISRTRCRQHGMRYDTSRVGPMYDAVFRQIHDLWGAGWYALRSSIGPVTKAVEPTPVESPRAVPAPVSSETEATGATCTSNVGRWNERYREVTADKPQSYGDAATYAIGAALLKDCATVEDWGTGMGGFHAPMRAANPDVDLVGVDGSETPFARVVTDLVHHKSRVEGIFMRHVLEHDPQWSSILDNALSSFTKRMVLVLFTPMQTETREIAWNGNGVPDIGFAEKDLIERFQNAGVKFDRAHYETKTQYGEESVFVLSK